MPLALVKAAEMDASLRRRAEASPGPCRRVLFSLPLPSRASSASIPPAARSLLCSARPAVARRAASVRPFALQRRPFFGAAVVRRPALAAARPEAPRPVSPAPMAALLPETPGGLALVLESLALFAIVWQLRVAVSDSTAPPVTQRTASGLAAVASALAAYLVDQQAAESLAASVELTVLWAMTLVLGLDALSSKPRATAEERRAVDDLVRAGIADRPAAERLLRSVVAVTASGKDGASAGSGWVFDRAGGIVVTCQHVVAPAAGPGGSVTVEAGGVRLPCRVIGTDAARDVAVLRVRTPSGRLPEWLESARIGESPAPAEGAPAVERLLGKGSEGPLEGAFREYGRRVDPRRVLAVRHPERAEAAAVCSGFVLSHAPGYTVWLGHAAPVLATDAPILSGYSGGPLVNYRGEVVGVNHIGISRESAIASGLGSRRTWPSDLPQVSLALSADEVVRVVGLFTRARRLADPLLGLTIDPDHDEGRAPGARVRSVLAGGAAAAAAVRPGDRIVVFDGTEVRGRTDLGRALYERAARERVQLVAIRGGRRVTFRVELALRGPSTARWIW